MKCPITELVNDKINELIETRERQIPILIAEIPKKLHTNSHHDTSDLYAQGTNDKVMKEHEATIYFTIGTCFFGLGFGE